MYDPSSTKCEETRDIVDKSEWIRRKSPEGENWTISGWKRKNRWNQESRRRRATTTDTSFRGSKKWFPLSTRWPLDFTGWCFSCKATVRLPLLPGGAIILCHFWNKVVFKQSRGDNAYALCLDISSCIGSKITHNCKRTTLCYKPAVSQESSSLPVLPVLEHARARVWGFSELSIKCLRAQYEE